MALLGGGGERGRVVLFFGLVGRLLIERLVESRPGRQGVVLGVQIELAHGRLAEGRTPARLDQCALHGVLGEAVDAVLAGSGRAARFGLVGVDAVERVEACRAHRERRLLDAVQLAEALEGGARLVVRSRTGRQRLVRIESLFVCLAISIYIHY